jgi:hypothetical protein
MVMFCIRTLSVKFIVDILRYVSGMSVEHYCCSASYVAVNMKDRCTE